MDIKVVLITLLVILGCLVSYSEMAMSRNYKTLDKYLRLIANPNKETKVYLNAAKAELEKVGQNPTPDSVDIECLEDFIKLETVLDQPECTYEEYEMMERVTTQAEGHMHMARPNSLTPVKKVVYEVGLVRANACRSKWPEKFAQAYSEISDRVKELAEFSNWDCLRQEGDTARRFTERLIDYRYTPDRHTTIYANNNILYHSQHDTDNSNYKLMIHNYLKGPCSEYRSKLHKIFLQVRYDAQMLPEYGGFPFAQNGDDDSLLPFYQAMAHNERCRLIDDKDFLKTLYDHRWKTQETESTSCFKFI